MNNFSAHIFLIQSNLCFIKRDTHLLMYTVSKCVSVLMKRTLFRWNWVKTIGLSWVKLWLRLDIPTSMDLQFWNSNNLLSLATIRKRALTRKEVSLWMVDEFKTKFSRLWFCKEKKNTPTFSCWLCTSYFCKC